MNEQGKLFLVEVFLSQEMADVVIEALEGYQASSNPEVLAVAAEKIRKELGYQGWEKP